MFDPDLSDLYLVGAFVTLLLVIVAVHFGYGLSVFAGLFVFFIFVHFWLTSRLQGPNGDSKSI